MLFARKERNDFTLKAGIFLPFEFYVSSEELKRLNTKTLANFYCRIHGITKVQDFFGTRRFAISINDSDREINHRYIALQMVEQFVRNEKCEISPDWVVISEVMQYHGVPYMYAFAHEYALPYIKLVSLADDVENGCNGALGYLELGEKFNKMTLCHTYTEYFVFAAMLAVNACNNAGEIAKEAMKDKCYWLRR